MVISGFFSVAIAVVVGYLPFGHPFGVACSFIPALRGLDLGYDVGMCLILAPFNADDVPAIISVC